MIFFKKRILKINNLFQNNVQVNFNQKVGSTFTVTMALSKKKVKNFWLLEQENRHVTAKPQVLLIKKNNFKCNEIANKNGKYTRYTLWLLN